MLSIDSEKLNVINYNGFSEKKIKVIKETIVLFQYFSVTIELKNNVVIEIDGKILNKPEYKYVLVIKDQDYFLVQVVKKSNNLLLFGIYIPNDKEDITKYIVYHDSMCSPIIDDEI